MADAFEIKVSAAAAAAHSAYSSVQSNSAPSHNEEWMVVSKSKGKKTVLQVEDVFSSAAAAATVPQPAAASVAPVVLDRRARAVKRLAHDLRELQENPLPNCSAAPVDDNLLLWHANLRAAEGNRLQQAVYHVILRFTDKYPAEGPSVDLCTDVPHPNVFPGLFGKRHHVCCDMFEGGVVLGAAMRYSGWSSAYSVSSVLQQLQALILHDQDLTETARISFANSITAANAYECKECGHTGLTPQPSVDAAPKPKAKVLITRPLQPAVRSVHTNQFTAPAAAFSWQSPASSSAASRRPSVTSQHSNTSGTPAAAVSIKTSVEFAAPMKAAAVSQTATGKAPAWSSLVNKMAAAATPSSTAAVQNTKGVVPDQKTSSAQSATEPQWEVVKGKSSSGRRHVTLSTGASKQPALRPVNLSSVTSTARVISVSATHAQLPSKPQLVSSALKVSAGARTSVQVQQQQQQEAAEQKYKSHHDQPALAIPLPSISVSKSPAAKPLTVPVKPQTAPMGISGGSKAAPSPATSNTVTVVSKPSGGFMSRLPYKVVLVHVMSFLEPRDAARLSCVNREMKEASEEGYLWKAFFERQYGKAGSELSAQQMKDWKYCFLLESNSVLSGLRCFHTRESFENDVLGVPLIYTVNPRTGKTDYIHSDFDVLSLQAFTVDKVRRTVYKEDFKLWLPLYITEDHYRRALPYIKKAIFNLAVPDVPPTQHVAKAYSSGSANWNWRNRDDSSASEVKAPTVFHPHMVLDVLPKFFSTQVTLLSDKGVQVSDRACEGIVAIHRLFLALVDTFQLQNEVERRIERFIRDPAARHKEVCPSVGALLPLLLVSNRFGWADIRGAALQEALARNVLWSCKAYPELAKLDVPMPGSPPVPSGAAAAAAATPAPAGKPPGDKAAAAAVDHEVKTPAPSPSSKTAAPVIEWERLYKTLDGTLVSHRIFMLHAFFLRQFRGSMDVPTAEIAHRYDYFYGRPSRYERTEFSNNMKRILTVTTWPQVFQQIGLRCPSPAALTAILRQAVRDSLNAGYHTKHTRFELIHRSGVSAIMLKGERYSAPPNLKRVSFMSSWSWLGNTKFLDASVLCCERDGTVKATADYSHTTVLNQAVIHSGDVIQNATREGRHTVTIDLSRLPSNVTHLYFALSSWMDTLRDIRSPSVRFHDPDTNMELCQYDLDSKPKGDNTAVLMCSLVKHEGRWRVCAIGEIGLGTAMNYAPIVAMCRKNL